jgi:hypothetical protein
LVFTGGGGRGERDLPQDQIDNEPNEKSQSEIDQHSGKENALNLREPWGSHGVSDI